MARRDLTNEEIEQMGREEPGSAARWLEERRAELAAEERERRQEDDKRAFAEEFVRAGGDPSAAEALYEATRDERALKAAQAADGEALQQSRRHIAGRL